MGYFTKASKYILPLLASGALFAQEPMLNHLGSYDSQDGEGAAEIVSFDAANEVLFMINGATNQVDMLDASNPSAITKIKSLDLSQYGSGPNSIAVKGDVVAIAMAGINSNQEKGRVVFYDTDGTYINDVEVGYLPDMLTFTPDGNKVVVANEGEPNELYDIDPTGSVSVVDVANGVANAVVTNIEFDSYNTKKAHLLNKGVRISGYNNPTVAQDLEPEYVTISEDGTKAFVACQENNAIAVVDLGENKLLDIQPLGFKDHMSGTPSLKSFIINEVEEFPELGTPIYANAEKVMLGGFSGLYFDEDESSSTEYVFYAIPDRGPNDAAINVADVTSGDPAKNLRPFKLPDYQARIVKFTVNPNDPSKIELDEDDYIFLTRGEGTPITGKGNIPGVDEVPVTYTDANTYTSVDYTTADANLAELSYDPYGGDFEGILRDENGNFWMCDEYRPAIYQFDEDGNMMHRYVAEGTGGENNEGAYGEEVLPEVYNKRRANRGFEGIAYDKDNGIIYAIIQSPLYNPSSITKNNSDVIRILGIDVNDGTPVAEYVYLLEANRDAGYNLGRVDKIGDIVYKGNGIFMVLERDSSNPNETPNGKKYVYEIDIKGATNILSLPISSKMTSTSEGDPTLEMMTADDLVGAGIQAVYKRKVLNLPSIGWKGSDKPEGLVLLPNNEMAVINDNDFGLGGAGVTDRIELGIISFDDNYGFDASNESFGVDISSRPTFGLPMPDAIASYQVNGVTYYVTANEGDGRVRPDGDYTDPVSGQTTDEGDVFEDEKRAGKWDLDPMVFSNANDLQEDENLGRLKTITTPELWLNPDNDEDIDRLFSFGTRSFSIFDEYGNLVFDSGNDFETISFEKYPLLFNSKDADIDEFKDRSDDKGPEPEGVVIGKLDGKTYAFIGIERTGGVFVYDITDPFKTQYVQYINTGLSDGDAAPEGLTFVDADDSPTSNALLFVANEVSGTVAVFEFAKEATSTVGLITTNENKELVAFPTATSGSVSFLTTTTGKVYAATGEVVYEFDAKDQINLNKLSNGLYIIVADDGSSTRVHKF